METEGNIDLDFINYLKDFDRHYNLLLSRYQRFIEIYDIDNASIDAITYLDMIVVQIRAMCIESSEQKNNYTAQILLKKLERTDLAERIDDMLDEDFAPGLYDDLSIRKALKLIADKFICHYDKADSYDWALADYIDKQLSNPYARFNLEYIMDTITSCIEEGLSEYM